MRKSRGEGGFLCPFERKLDWVGISPKRQREVGGSLQLQANPGLTGRRRSRDEMDNVGSCALCGLDVLGDFQCTDPMSLKGMRVSCV